VPPYARAVGPDRPPLPPGRPLPTRVQRVERWGRANPRRVDLLLAAAVGVPLAALSAAAVVAEPSPVGWTVVQLGAAVSVLLALAARRTGPAASFGAVSLALAVSELAPRLSVQQPFLPAAVAFPVSLYSYCAYGGARAPRLGAAVGVAGALLITGRWLVETPAAERGTTDTLLGALLLLGFLLAVVAAAWCFGLFRTVRSVYLAALEERARLAEAEREERARRAVRDERDRIAREMHDVVAHSLSVIVTQAQAGAYVARNQPERAGRALDTIADTGREALADMRGLLGVLRSDAADTGRTEPPQPGLADLPDLLARVRASGLPVQLAEDGTPSTLGATTELAVYRLVQESLTNVLKHAGPDATARVQLTWTEDELVVSVTDDGYGLTSGAGGGQGLIGMRERVAVLGGSTSAEPGPGGGFAVQARLPVQRACAPGSPR
jgi:signal transduction histidine kinase